MSIVHDRGIDSVRRLSVDERMQTDATARTIPPCPTDPSRQGSPQDDARTIRVALQALPESGRSVIELAYFGGWTLDEIAEKLKLPLDVVRHRAREGLLMLRDALLSEAPP